MGQRNGNIHFPIHFVLQEQNEIQLAQAQRRLRILETDFAENEEASSKLRVAQDRLAAVSAEAEDKKREVESLTSNVMVLQGAQKKQQVFYECQLLLPSSNMADFLVSLPCK